MCNFFIMQTWKIITLFRVPFPLQSLVLAARLVVYIVTMVMLPGAAWCSEAPEPCRGGTSCHVWAVAGQDQGWAGVCRCLLLLTPQLDSAIRRSVHWIGLPATYVYDNRVSNTLIIRTCINIELVGIFCIDGVSALPLISSFHACTID